MSKGMMLIEAIKSGRKFRHKNSEIWLYVNDREEIYAEIGSCFITAKDILAEDWEIQEKKIEITRDQLAKAWDNHSPQAMSESWEPAFFDDICKELGFDE